MTNTYPACLNEAGQAHVAQEIERLGLGWDVATTCLDIESDVAFGELVQGEGDGMSYEISKNAAAAAGVGNSGYGAFAWIEVCADKHVMFEQTDD